MTTRRNVECLSRRRFRLRVGSEAGVVATDASTEADCRCGRVHGDIDIPPGSEDPGRERRDAWQAGSGTTNGRPPPGGGGRVADVSLRWAPSSAPEGRRVLDEVDGGVARRHQPRERRRCRVLSQAGRVRPRCLFVGSSVRRRRRPCTALRPGTGGAAADRPRLHAQGDRQHPPHRP